MKPLITMSIFFVYFQLSYNCNIFLLIYSYMVCIVFYYNYIISQKNNINYTYLSSS